MRIAFSLIAPIAAVSLGIASVAWAQGPGPGRGQGPREPGTGPVAEHCQDEIVQLCEGLEHGGRAIRTCLEKNKAKVSAACKNALETTGPGRRFQ